MKSFSPFRNAEYKTYRVVLFSIKEGDQNSLFLLENLNYSPFPLSENLQIFSFIHSFFQVDTCAIMYIRVYIVT